MNKYKGTRCESFIHENMERSLSDLKKMRLEHKEFIKIIDVLIERQKKMEAANGVIEAFRLAGKEAVKRGMTLDELLGPDFPGMTV